MYYSDYFWTRVCKRFGLLVVLLLSSGGCLFAQGIQPYVENPRYWEYQRNPSLLLGATNNDNLFQSEDLIAQLDLLASVGGNYIRNTMSSRDSADLWPFFLQEDGRYDLDRWNQAYWQRFETMLRATHERGIIVQIELWDRFDYSRDPWLLNPFNPQLNDTYSTEEIGMEKLYPQHPSKDLQPFFHSIPGMKRYTAKLDLLRSYQEKYIQKVLAHSLAYDHVLYCINNETSTASAWGDYWIKFLEQQAKQKGKKIYVSDMYDHFFKPQACEPCQTLIADPETYTFIDMSQINSRNFGQAHWDTLQWIVSQREKYDLRPMNCTKVYGGDNRGWGSGSNRDGVERFFRNALGGVAAVRHHRPPTGNGLNANAQAAIKALRSLEKQLSFWELQPMMERMKENEANEAYMIGKDSEGYLIYFPREAKVQLQLEPREYLLQSLAWYSGKWVKSRQLEVKKGFRIENADPKGSFLLLKPIKD